MNTTTKAALLAVGIVLAVAIIYFAYKTLKESQPAAKAATATTEEVPKQLAEQIQAELTKLKTMAEAMTTQTPTPPKATTTTTTPPTATPSPTTTTTPTSIASIQQYTQQVEIPKLLAAAKTVIQPTTPPPATIPPPKPPTATPSPTTTTTPTSIASIQQYTQQVEIPRLLAAAQQVSQPKPTTTTPTPTPTYPTPKQELTKAPMPATPPKTTITTPPKILRL